jgi:hypothetical protein
MPVYQRSARLEADKNTKPKKLGAKADRMAPPRPRTSMRPPKATAIVPRILRNIFMIYPLRVLQNVESTFTSMGSGFALLGSVFTTVDNVLAVIFTLLPNTKINRTVDTLAYKQCVKPSIDSPDKPQHTNRCGTYEYDPEK